MRVLSAAIVLATALVGCSPTLPGPPPLPAGRSPRDAGRPCPTCPGSRPRDAGRAPDSGAARYRCETMFRECADEVVCVEGVCVATTSTDVPLDDGTTMRATRFPERICTERCDPGDAAPCDCGACITYSLLGRARIALGIEGGICRPRCEWSACPDGYLCDPLTRACLEPCTDDASCAISGEDLDGDGADDVLRSEAGWVCDAGRCRREGEPRGCVLDDECPEGEACLRVGGRVSTCLPAVDHCDSCEGACAWSAGPRARHVCAPACEPAAEPVEDRLGAGGHGAGCAPELACRRGIQTARWGCLPGEYNDVVEPNWGAPCASDDECYSPYGAGSCMALDGGRRCTVACADLIAAGGDATLLCDEARGVRCSPTLGCLPSCTTDADCEPPLACTTETGSDLPTCGPRCTGPLDCPGPSECAEVDDGSDCGDRETCRCELR